MISVSKSLIINNFEWIINNQIAMDMFELSGLKNDLIEVYDKIKEFVPDDLIVDGDLYELENCNIGKYYSLYNYFKNLTKIQKNKDTYLPNLVGIYLVINLDF
jgi:hypothetical protein